MPDFDYQSSVSILSPKDLLDTPQPLSELTEVVEDGSEGRSVC